MVRVVYQQFSEFGEIEDIHYNSRKCEAFIMFKHRFYAEFAREAMIDQVLTEGITNPITIKWAVLNPFDNTEELSKKVKDQQEAAEKSRTIGEKAKMEPKDLVPQLPDHVKKREDKILEKARKKELQELYKIHGDPTQVS
jgi:hypothetical protein